jgi:hypothetical protein
MEVKVPLSLDEVWTLMRLVPLAQINTVVVETEGTAPSVPSEWRSLDWGRGFTRRAIDWTEDMLREAFLVGTMRIMKVITRRGVYLIDRANRYIFVNDITPLIIPQNLNDLGIVAGRYEWVF